MRVLCSMGVLMLEGKLGNEERSEDDKEEMADRILGVVVRSTIVSYTY